MRQGKLNDYVNRHAGATNVLHFGSRSTEELYVNLCLLGGDIHYEIALRPNYDDSLYYNTVRVGLQSDDLISWEGESAEASKKGIEVRAMVDDWVVYHFHDTGEYSPMKRTAQVDDNRFLRGDGSNLAAYLYFLRVKHSKAYELIRSTIQHVAPFFVDFVLEPLRLNEQTLKLEWRHAGSDSYFTASAFSDGTLRFIALATLLLQPAELRPSVILIDEPDIGLHPFAIAMLASMVKRASLETQVIVSTQSPTLLDHFAPEDVLVADRVDGGTQLRRLNSSELASWLEDYSLGQLWEKNELGGFPASE